MPLQSAISKSQKKINSLKVKAAKIQKRVDIAIRTLTHSDKMWANHKASEPKSADMIAFHNAITTAHKAELKKQYCEYNTAMATVRILEAEQVRDAEVAKLTKPQPPKEPQPPKAKFADPFKDEDEATIDDIIEELWCIGEDSPEDLEDELKAGYKCTKKQLAYWLKKKYIDTTSRGEELYEILTEE